MQDIHTLIHNSFEVVSLILVFAFVLFDIRYPQIINQLDKDIPPTGRKKERLRHAKDLRRTLLVGDLPLIIVYGICAYLFSPLFITVLSNSKLHLWRFDFLLSAFVIVYIFLLVFLLWSLYLALRLIRRFRETNIHQTHN